MANETLRIRMVFAWTLVVCGFTSALQVEAAQRDERPNFLVIVADDLAYSDLGAFGGEIDTPNLDALATAGARFTAFNTSPTCSPTRSMLITGVDHHVVGIGNMAELMTEEQRGKPGYEGYLNDRAATIAERLRAGGYHTMLSGKWHLGTQVGQRPVDRGFERSFALLQGGDNHFGLPDKRGQRSYVEDDKPLPQPVGTYSTEYFTNNLITLLKESRSDSRPFFAYLAYTAPHWPLQAPDEAIAKYRGKYDAGYEVLRERRLQRQRAQGLLGDVPSHPLVGTRPWASLTPEEKAFEARKMEVYAAMIDLIDVNVGRVLQELRDSGRADNTVVVFLSDNGAAGGNYEAVGTFDKNFGKWVADNYDNRIENIGRANSMVWYGPGWGQAGTAPSFLYKIFTAQGGTRVPLIVSGPHVKRGVIGTEVTHVTDVAATILDLASVPADAKSVAGRPTVAVQGVSWVPILNGTQRSVRGPTDVIGGELFGGRSLIQGDYKALYLSDLAKNVGTQVPVGRWLLFNIAQDPGEVNDLAAKEPQRLQSMVERWDDYARSNGVILPQPGSPVKQIRSGERTAEAR